MKLRKRSIIRHTVVTTSIMLFVFCAIMGFLIYNRSKSLLSKQIMRNALDVAMTCAAHIDAEAFSRIGEGDEGNEDYQKVLDSLILFRDHSEVEYVYTVVYNASKIPVFSVDSDAEDPAAIGEVFGYSNATFSALNGTAASDSKPMTDEWGTHLSAYAPIMLDGKAIGAVGVDLDYNWIKQAFHKILYLIVLICVIFCIIGVLVLRNVGGIMRKEIKALDVKIDGLRADAPNMMMSKDLRQGDEFEYLADHINSVFEDNRKIREKEKMNHRFFGSDLPDEASDVQKEEPVRQEVVVQKPEPQQSALPVPQAEPDSELHKAFNDTGILQYAETKRYLEDEDLIRTTLKEFYDGIRENADAIEQFLRSEDYDNYTIKVHALKSSARMIGAGELSENARILEDLGNRMNRDMAG